MTTAEAETGGALVEKAGRLSELAQRSLRDFDAEACRHQAEDWITHRPISSVVLALAAGFLLARMIRS